MRRGRGILLVESTVAFAVLAAAFVAVIPLTAAVMKVDQAAREIAVAGLLSQELLEEVRLRRWDETTPKGGRAASGTALGPDAGESASGKSGFDDVDDFSAWEEDPPSDPIGRALPRLAGYRRTVDVAYLDDDLAVAASTTPFKRARVCTARAGMRPVCLDALFANR